jgi:glyoxylate reductase
MEALGARRAGSLEQLLSESDVVSIHLPLVEETHGLLGPAELALMRPNSILVNTARGDIVDTQALVAALRAGRPAAAGLDVYADEPEIPRDLRELDNAFVLPHLGSATREARRGMWRLAADNVRRVLAGDAPLTPVTPI